MRRCFKIPSTIDATSNACAKKPDTLINVDIDTGHSVNWYAVAPWQTSRW